MTTFSAFIRLILLILVHVLVSVCNASVLNSSIPHKTPTTQQLATVYQDGIIIKDYWISEKLDGIRARWNGSNLISRRGNIIHAPLWFVQDFPQQTIEGELWLARKKFEQTASIVLRDTPNQDWQNIKFMLFDLPDHTGNFSQRITAMQNIVTTIASPYLQVIPQFKLSSQMQLIHKLDELVAQGAEGLMLHHQNAYYQDGRSSQLLKLKKHMDAEAKVIAHLAGKGKYQNMLGALLVELDNGLQFKIGSGFSDSQRQTPPAIGTIITFKYYGLTARGIPRFASFLRIKP
ncbi:DNA ligase [Paraglaciecola sp. L3A3]|uniref:DNA ligase n=1 Tax=Paraglaciecola sp. L3A3 TaxID=2686358 RepID=UPI00131E58EC|nr:DNA ligase [Paraglaciecola sp. L3A3]